MLFVQLEGIRMFEGQIYRRKGIARRAPLPTLDRIHGSPAFRRIEEVKGLRPVLERQRCLDQSPPIQAAFERLCQVGLGFLRRLSHPAHEDLILEEMAQAQVAKNAFHMV